MTKTLLAFLAVQVVFLNGGEPVKHRDVPATEWQQAVKAHLEHCHRDIVLSDGVFRTYADQLRRQAAEIDACNATRDELRKLLDESEAR